VGTFQPIEGAQIQGEAIDKASIALRQQALTRDRTTFSAGASAVAPSFALVGLSAESCMSKVQRVKLSMSNCMMSVECTVGAVEDFILIPRTDSSSTISSYRSACGGDCG
jgi:hypothetical protein